MNGTLQFLILKERLILLDKQLEDKQGGLIVSCLVALPLGWVLVLLTSFNIFQEIQVILQWQDFHLCYSIYFLLNQSSWKCIFNFSSPNINIYIFQKSHWFDRKFKNWTHFPLFYCIGSAPITMITSNHNGRPYILQRISTTTPQSRILCEKGKTFCHKE